MRLTPIVSWRVASVCALLSFRAVPCPHLYPMPLHTPSLTHAPTTPSFEKRTNFIFKLNFGTFKFENGTVRIWKWNCHWRGLGRGKEVARRVPWWTRDARAARGENVNRTGAWVDARPPYITNEWAEWWTLGILEFLLDVSIICQCSKTGPPAKFNVTWERPDAGVRLGISNITVGTVRSADCELTIWIEL